MKRKLVSLAALSLVAVMTACSAVSADTETTVTTNQESQKKTDMNQVNKGTIAKVTEVNGNSITFVTAEMEKGNKEPNNNGEPPAKPEGGGEGETMAEPPEKPEGGGEGTTATELTTNVQGQHKNIEKPEMTFGTETKTLTIDISKLYCEGEKGGEKVSASLTDVKEGTILDIQYGEDGTTVQSITIKK